MPEASFEPLAGGPAHRVLSRAGLLPNDARGVVRSAVLLAMVGWVPLVLLSAMQGILLDGGVTIPFARDMAAHARILFAVPVFCLAELVVGQQLASVVGRLVHTRLVSEADVPRLETALADLARRRDSNLDESVLLVLAFAGGWSGAHVRSATGVTTWLMTVTDTGMHFTLPGWWYAVVSAPIFLFLFLRWLWRGVLWSRFLWRLARVDLGLVATHPDHAGGLAFVGGGQAAFGIVLFALSAVLSAELAERVVYGGAHVMEHKALLGGWVVLGVAVVFGPLLVLARPLAAARQTALGRYSVLLTAHHRAFEARWLDRHDAVGEALLGSPDPSSLADLGAAYGAVEQMRPVPVTASSLVGVALAAALPLVPLVALEVPLRDIIIRLIGILA